MGCCIVACRVERFFTFFQLCPNWRNFSMWRPSGFNNPWPCKASIYQVEIPKRTRILNPSLSSCRVEIHGQALRASMYAFYLNTYFFRSKRLGSLSTQKNDENTGACIQTNSESKSLAQTVPGRGACLVMYESLGVSCTGQSMRQSWPFIGGFKEMLH